MKRALYQQAMVCLASLSVAWHCVAGCCGHHLHEPARETDSAAIAVTACCHHVACGQQLHDDGDEGRPTPALGSDISKRPLSHQTPGDDCCQTECAFAFDKSKSRDRESAESSFVEISVWASIVYSTTSACAMGSDREQRQWSASCARCARVQQLLCVWRL